jgi:hypothetical protein
MIAGVTVLKVGHVKDFDPRAGYHVVEPDIIMFCRTNLLVLVPMLIFAFSFAYGRSVGRSNPETVSAFRSKLVVTSDTRTRSLSAQVKIQKMRSSLEEKLMRRMSTVHRRAEEWRTTAQAQHVQQLRRAADGSSVRRLKAASHLPGSDAAATCGCFPCNGNVVSGNLLNYY